MKIVPEHIDNWIASALSGEADSGTLAQLRAWIEESDEHRRYFEESETAYLNSFEVKDEFEPDTDAAWQNLKNRIKPAVAWRNRGQLRSLFFRVAAAAMVVLTAGIWWINRSSSEITYSAAGGSREMETVTHGSGLVMHLDRESIIEYADSADKVIVRLKGRARFAVSGSESGALQVRAGGLLIEDIGTEFTVDARDDRTVTVEVTDGLVRLSRRNSDELFDVAAGHSAEYHSDTGECIIRQMEDDDPSPWFGNSIQFRNTPLKKVVVRLSDLFNREVVLGNSEIGQCRITVAFTDEEEEEIIAIIAETLNLSYSIEANRIVLNGAGCMK